MKKMNRVWSILLALTMMCASAVPALADGGNQLLYVTENNDLFAISQLGNVLVMGQKIYLFMNGTSQSLQTVDLTTGETETWKITVDMEEEAVDGQEETEEAEEPTPGAEPTPTPETAPDEADGDEGELEESFDSTTDDVQGWFVWRDELYAIVNYTVRETVSRSIDGGHVRKVTLADGKVNLAEEDTLKLDWTNMIITEGDWSYSRYPGSMEAAGDRLYMICYGDLGQALCIFNLTDGSMTEQAIQDMNDIAVLPDGRLMVSTYEWGETSEQVLSIYDPDTESMQPLARFDLSKGSPQGIAYDPESGSLYYACNGEIFLAPGADLTQAVAVNDCSMNPRTFSRLMPDGRLLLWNYNFAALRTLDPSQRANVTLRVRPFAWSGGLDNACFHFSSDHSGISLVREEFGDESTMLQSMMNRDSQVDVYLMSLESDAYNAVFERGFQADLSGNAKLTGAVEKMYPFIRDAVTRNGKLVAIPLTINGSGMGFKTEHLEKLGLTEADLPKTWEQFFDFLEELPDRIQGTEFRLFDLYTYRDDFKWTMMNTILTQYSMEQDGAPFNSELIRRLAGRIQALDCERLGILDEEELQRVDEEGTYEEMGGNKESLLSTYCEYTVQSWREADPLPLALEEGSMPVLPVSMTVAFVNPYSEHPEEAMMLLESLLDYLDTSARYSLYPDQNEPMRYPNHEEQKKEMEKWAAEAKKNLEKAETEEEKANWEEIVQMYDKELADYDRTNWMISPDTIASYRVRAEYLRPIRWNYFRAVGQDDSWEKFWEIRTSFINGTADAAEMLTYLDKKVQMMRLEGN